MRLLRSCLGTAEWLRKQFDGDCGKHIVQMLLTVLDATVLTNAMSIIDVKRVALAIGYDLVVEEEFADMFLGFAVALATARTRRMIFLLCGYPHKFAGLLGDSIREATIMRWFKVDVENWEVVKRVVGKTRLMAQREERHLFELICNQQYIQAAREFLFAPHADIRTLQYTRNRCLSHRFLQKK